jgi:hypothetical protein
MSIPLELGSVRKYVYNDYPQMVDDQGKPFHSRFYSVESMVDYAENDVGRIYYCENNIPKLTPEDRECFRKIIASRYIDRKISEGELDKIREEELDSKLSRFDREVKAIRKGRCEWHIAEEKKCRLELLLKYMPYYEKYIREAQDEENAK